MFCALSGIFLSWKTLVLGRSTSRERTNVHRTAFFLHTPDFSLSKVTALKVAWGKDTSSRSKEPGIDLPSCFSARAPFCKCGWRHHISRSGCGPDCYSYKIFRHFWLAAIPRLIFHNRRSISFQGRELKKKMAFAAIRIWIWIWISKEGSSGFFYWGPIFDSWLYEIHIMFWLWEKAKYKPLQNDPFGSCFVINDPNMRDQEHYTDKMIEKIRKTWCTILSIQKF